MPRTPTRHRLEALESRWCPSCTVLQDRDTLFITGDRGDNRVEIAQVDDLTLRVTCDGGPAQAFREVRRVIVDTLAGNDEVHYLLESPAALPRDMRVQLGAGDDQFQMQGAPEMAGERRAAIEVLGAAGDDRVGMIMPCVRGPLEFRADLGDGNDGFTGELVDVDGPAEAGPLDPGNRVAVLIDGGRGGDTFHMTLGNPPEGGRSSLFNSDVYMAFEGCFGADRATIVQNNLVVNAALAATLDLGDGPDVGRVVINHVATGPEGVVAVNTDGGPGADRMIQDANEFTGTLVSSSHGGPGDDVMIANANDFTGTLALLLEGDQGGDSVFARVGFNPQPDPPGGFPVFRGATVGVNGGSGDDLIDVRLDLGNHPGARAVATVQGGAGDDQIGLALVGMDSLDLVTALVDGGAGFDVALVSSGVRTLLCEEVVLLR